MDYGISIHKGYYFFFKNLYLYILSSREKALLTLHAMTKNAFFTSENPKKYHAWSCRNVCDVLTFLLDNILFNLAPSCIDK